MSSQLNTITASSNDIIETQSYSEPNIDVPASNVTQSPSAAPKICDLFTSYTENAVTPEMKLKLTDLVERLSEKFEQVLIKCLMKIHAPILEIYQKPHRF